MKYLAVIILSILNTVSAYAAWDTSVKQDPMTDEKTVFSGVNSTDGKSRFWIYADKQGRVIGGFKTIGAFNQIHYRYKVINVRVDKNEARSINITEWEPKLVFFNIDKNDGFLEELMDGKTLLVEYYSSGTQTKIQKFRLTGSTKAILSALPGYERLEVREKRKAEEEAKQTAKMQQEWRKNSSGDVRERAKKECPDELEEIEKIERETGRPQMFRGCSSW